jgi:hypothetical protein
MDSVMLKFACQTTDNQVNQGGIGSENQYHLEREMLMAALNNAMETSDAKPQPPGSVLSPTAIQAVSLEDCISTAHQLLTLLQEETVALKGFQSEALMPLITRKGALVKDLSDSIGTLRSPHEPSGRIDGTPEAEGANAASRPDPTPAGTPGRRVILRKLLGEIERCNDTNRVFIEGSPIYWQDLRNLILPGIYTLDQEGQAARRTVSTKGLALNKEI